MELPAAAVEPAPGVGTERGRRRPEAPIAPEPAASAPTSLPALAEADAVVGERSRIRRPLGAMIFLAAADGFILRVVVTSTTWRARWPPPRLWPVQPTPKPQSVWRSVLFRSARQRCKRWLSPRWPSLSPPAGVLSRAALYWRFYPLFQQAYADLGHLKG